MVVKIMITRRRSFLLLGTGLLVFVLAGLLVLTGADRSAGRSGIPQPAAAATDAPTPTPAVSGGVSPISTATLAATSSLSASQAVPSARLFDGARAYEHVLAQEAIGVRPTGSQAGWKTGDYIIEQLEAVGWQVETQEFTFKGVRGRNIVGKTGQGPVIILGAHYDTRPAADREADPADRQKPILGANDGGSGVAVLLELARVLNPDRLKHEVWLAFFDAEDRGHLDGWPFSVGAQEMARRLELRPQAVIVVDMVGDADQNIYYEYNSDEQLMRDIWSVAARLGYADNIIPKYRYNVIDDHVPFAELGIPAVDMIDFDYPYWHTLADTSDKVSPLSLERVGRTLQVWLESR